MRSLILRQLWKSFSFSFRQYSSWPHRLLSSPTIRQPNSFGHEPAPIALILWVVFPAGDQRARTCKEQEPALHLDPTVHALMLALMLTKQFARCVPGVAKPATESLKKLTLTNNHFGSPFQWWAGINPCIYSDPSTDIKF